MATTVKNTSTLDLTMSDRAGNQFTWKLNNPNDNLNFNTVNGLFQSKIVPYEFTSRWNSRIVALDAAATVETVVTKTTLE